MAQNIRYSYETLKTFCTDAFLKFGFTEEEATDMLDRALALETELARCGVTALVNAELPGCDTTGLPASRAALTSGEMSR